MDHNEQAGKNFAWLSLAQAVTRIFGAVYFIFIAYKLKAVGLGEYNFVAAFVPLWFLAIDFGGGSYLFREWTRGTKQPDEIESDFHRLFTLRLILVSCVAVPFLILNYYINRQVFSSLILFYVSMFLATFANLLDLYFQSQNLYRFLATRQVIEKVSAVLFGVIFLILRPTVEMAFIAVLISQVISIAYYYLFCFPFGIKLAFNKRYALQLFVKGLPFLFIGIFASLYAKIDMTMLRYYTNFESVGYYSAAYKFLDFSFLFASLFVSAVYPLFSQLWAEGQRTEEFEKFFQKSFRIIFSGGLLITLFLIVAAPLLIRYFFPATFGPAVLALRILAISQILGFVSLLFSTLLIIEGREKYSLYILGFGALFNILLNIFLIPRFSLYGAAWATVIAEATNLFLLQNYIIWQKPQGLVLKTLLLVVYNATAFLALKYFGLTNNPYAGILVVLTNVAILFTVKLMQKEDIIFFLKPFVKKLRSLQN